MKAILEFIERIHLEKDQIFESRVKEFESKAKEGDWNGTKLEITNQSDVFFYLSEDKKSIKTSWDDFDPRIPFSFLIYFCFRYEVANYTNGGLKFIGFYDDNYEKVESIEIGDFEILKCDDGCNFDQLRKPTFYYSLKHKYGNQHTSLRGYARIPSSIQNALNSIWELDNFYKDWYERFVYSPKDRPEKK
jgi:hypothetical protein